MEVRFRETFDLPVEEVFSYFESPREWVRLFGFAGEVEERGDGWFAVPLKAFPFPLVAKNVELEPRRHVRWRFRGFWKGEGEVWFEADGRQVTVEGFERVSVRWLGPLSGLVERLVLQRRFEFIWNIGWRRLRKSEESGAAATA